MTKPEVVCRIDWNKDYNRGRREGRLEAYKDVQKWIDKMDMPYDDFDYGLFNRFLERRKKELM